MLHIAAEGLGKKYFKEWIFRKMDYHFVAGKAYAVTGPNGSGKSTLLKTLSGAIPASEGKLRFYKHKKEVEADYWPRYISYAAPYLEIIEEFTLKELLEFHFSLKNPRDFESPAHLAEKMYLQDAFSKQIKYFSSGMKQRLKLGLAFFADTPILMLDEPTSNLDKKGIDWYFEQIDTIKEEKLLIICSNQSYEYSFCEEVMDINVFKSLRKNN